MIGHFILKEIVESIKGHKFIITFIICTVLILLSVYSGYELYREELRWLNTAESANQTAMANEGSYGNLKTSGQKVFRAPSRMSIFVRGVDSVIGKAASVGSGMNIVLRDSRFGLNPVFAVFGELDLAFIVKIILALFALIFSYNAVSGERELGTLKQVFSNNVGRAKFIFGKTVGGLITLLLPFLVPLILALLMLMLVFSVTFSPEEWIRLGFLVGIFCLYLAVFYMIGMLMSALTRHSFVSFLLCLFVWVFSVVIVPRLAVEAAGYISPAPSIDRLEAERAMLRRDYYKIYKELSTRYLTEHLEKNRGRMGREDRERIMNQAQKEATEQLGGREENLLRDYELAQGRLLRTAETIARLSPTSCVTLAADKLSSTDAELQDRFLRSLRRHRETFIQYIDRMIAENPDKSQGGVGTSISSDIDDEGNFSFSVNVTVPEFTIDVGGAPDFQIEEESMEKSLAGVIPDLAVLVFEIVLFFALAFTAFLSYDVR
jgi:ABC-type transport system involved in multi-copper enzyme maturation permease subunit